MEGGGPLCVLLRGGVGSSLPIAGGGGYSSPALMSSALAQDVSCNLILVSITSGLRVVTALVAIFWVFVCLFLFLLLIFQRMLAMCCCSYCPAWLLFSQGVLAGFGTWEKGRQTWSVGSTKTMHVDGVVERVAAAGVLLQIYLGRNLKIGSRGTENIMQYFILSEFCNQE